MCAAMCDGVCETFREACDRRVTPRNHYCGYKTVHMIWERGPQKLMKHERARILLIVVEAFAAVSALVGGYGVIATNGIGMHMAWLKTTAFVDYHVPGLILGILVGGSALIATFLLLVRHPWGYLAALGAGAIMVGWIVGEILLIQQLSWLQLVYALDGLAAIGLAGFQARNVYRLYGALVPHGHEL